MKVLLLCVVLSGCAIGRVTPEGDLTGYAIGHAKLMHCHDDVCDTIQGGALSQNFVETLSTIGAALAAAFTAGVL